VNCLSGSGYSSVAEPASPQDEHISFHEFKNISFHEFKNRVNAEREVSLHMAWLSKSEILRNIAQALSFRDGKSTAEEDALCRLRGLTKEELKEKVNAASQTVVDASLFTARYGGLDDFKGGVSDRIGAPHPKVWEEIMREHRESGDSKTKFKPGNYDMNDGTTSEIEYAVVTDPKKGKEVSNGKRKVKSLEELQDVRLAKEAKLIKEELTAISLYTGPMFYKYNAVLRNFPQAALDTCKNLDNDKEWNRTYSKYAVRTTRCMSPTHSSVYCMPRSMCASRMSRRVLYGVLFKYMTCVEVGDPSQHSSVSTSTPICRDSARTNMT